MRDRGRRSSCGCPAPPAARSCGAGRRWRRRGGRRPGRATRRSAGRRSAWRRNRRSPAGRRPGRRRSTRWRTRRAVRAPGTPPKCRCRAARRGPPRRAVPPCRADRATDRRAPSPDRLVAGPAQSTTAAAPLSTPAPPRDAPPGQGLLPAPPARPAPPSPPRGEGRGEGGSERIAPAGRSTTINPHPDLSHSWEREDFLSPPAGPAA